MTLRAGCAAVAGVVLALNPLASSAGAVDLKDGLWRIAYEIEIPMRGPDTGPIMREMCLKSEEIRQIVTPPNSPCRMEEVVATERKLTWKLRCEPPIAATGEGRLEFRGERFEGTVTTVGGPPQRMRVTQKMAGRYLGPCTARSPVARPEGALRKYGQE